MSELRNQEKAAIVYTLKNKYPLPVLLEKLNFSHSSYYYQRKKRSGQISIPHCRKRSLPYFKRITAVMVIAAYTKPSGNRERLSLRR